MYARVGLGRRGQVGVAALSGEPIEKGGEEAELARRAALELAAASGDAAEGIEILRPEGGDNPV